MVPKKINHVKSIRLKVKEGVIFRKLEISLIFVQITYLFKHLIFNVNLRCYFNYYIHYTSMKIRKPLELIIIASLLLSITYSCKTHKDCRGRKKTVKTAMGGWL